VHGQSENSSSKNKLRNNILIGFFGDASMFSLNYERMFRINNIIYFSGKIGIGRNEAPQAQLSYNPATPILTSCITFPLHCTFNLNVAHHRKRKAFLELGLGVTIMAERDQQNYLTYPIVGMRAYPFNRFKLNYRLYSHLPYVIVNYDDFDGNFVPFGFSLGYSF
jgi:hypothetical protein